jgi:hypothetical protein
VLVPLFILVLGKEFDMPFPVKLLKAYYTNPGIEEHIEFLHTHMEYARESKMPQLMYQYKERQG